MFGFGFSPTSSDDIHHLLRKVSQADTISVKELNGWRGWNMLFYRVQTKSTYASLNSHIIYSCEIASYFFHFILSSDSLSQQICYVYSSTVTVINTLSVIPYDIAYFQKYYNGREKHGYHQQQKCCPIKR